MMRNMNYSKYYRQYLIVDITVGFLAVMILGFAFVREQKILFSKRLVKDIKRNWETPPIVDMVKIPNNLTECPSGYVHLINETFLGSNEGCFCESGNETYIYEGTCMSSRGEKDKCRSVAGISTTRMTKWRGSDICIQREKYVSNVTYFINKFDLITTRDGACTNNTKKCGILDSNDTPFCQESNLPCPINDVFIMKSSSFNPNKTSIKYSIIQLDNQTNLYFSNQNTVNKVQINYDVSDGGICLDFNEHNYNSRIYPLFKDQDPYNCDNLVNGVGMDDRYKINDGYPVDLFYKEHGNLYNELSSLPNWEKEYFNKTSRIELYSRPYISWKSNCTQSNTHPRNLLGLNQSIIDITDLQNELFYFHIIVFLSYLLLNIYVKWRLIKERVEFVYTVLLEGIYVALSLIEVAICIVGISKFNEFYSTCFFLRDSNCSDQTTTMVLGFLGETFYNFALHFYVIAFFAVLSCFIYPLNSMYIYLQTVKADAKELQNLVSA